jgi:endogenous inhibitor of DNA gyrase (YacG/DUF329 family)
MERTAKCPTCKRALTVEPGAAANAWPHRPFCSERCRTIDLGGWLDGAYRISAPASEEDLDGAPAEEDDPDDKPAN